MFQSFLIVRNSAHLVRHTFRTAMGLLRFGRKAERRSQKMFIHVSSEKESISVALQMNPQFLQNLAGLGLGRGAAAPQDGPMSDTAETVHISSLALLKMLKHGTNLRITMWTIIYSSLCAEWNAQMRRMYATNAEWRKNWSANYYLTDFYVVTSMKAVLVYLWKWWVLC